jgi:hypothetical protein
LALFVAGAAGCDETTAVPDGGAGDGLAGVGGQLPGAGTGGGAGVGGASGGGAGRGDTLSDDGGVALDAASGPAVDADVADAAVDAGAPRPKPRCLAKGSQVVLLGDSYINWVSHTFPADLNREAGQTFRMYAVGGYSMGSGGIGFIPPELDQAVAADPDITTVVMTGGGNDVLVADTAQFPRGGDCKMSEMSPTIPDCQKIVAKALAAADKMMNDGIAKLGNEITDVVYFFYPNVPEGTLVGGTHPNAILEYAAPMVEAFCDGAYQRSGGKVACHFVDLRPVFKGHPEYFAPTDIHPNGMGSAAMAKAVWQTMKDNCLAQPASSGCCEP